MATSCYTMVKAAAMRVTELSQRGEVTRPVRWAASRAVVSISVEDVVDERGDEMLRDENDRPRVHLSAYDDVLAYVVNATFAKVDPSLLSLMTGLPVVLNADGTVVGYDAETKIPLASFGLEVWSRLRGVEFCDQWGYTLFPFLKGGLMSGVTFDGGLVSFTVTGSRTMRCPRWSVGPYDFTGWHERLIEPVSGNLAWKNFVTSLAPPVDAPGVQVLHDIISNGSAADPHPLRAGSLLGGSADSAGAWLVNGGGA